MSRSDNFINLYEVKLGSLGVASSRSHLDSRGSHTTSSPGASTHHNSVREFTRADPGSLAVIQFNWTEDPNPEWSRLFKHEFDAYDHRIEVWFSLHKANNKGTFVPMLFITTNFDKDFGALTNLHFRPKAPGFRDEQDGKDWVMDMAMEASRKGLKSLDFPKKWKKW